MLFKADPTFYPSPKLAAQAPAEKLAYVAALHANGGTKPDALAVINVDAQSDAYGNIVGKVDMPNVGDELHHFGWNACSSALCPYAPHPHVERRYLILPGLRSSRIHVLDTKPDPGKPKIVKVIRIQPSPYGALRSRRYLPQCSRRAERRWSRWNICLGP